MEGLELLPQDPEGCSKRGSHVAGSQVTDLEKAPGRPGEGPHHRGGSAQNKLGMPAQGTQGHLWSLSTDHM